MLRYVKSKGIEVELYDTFYFIDSETARELIEIGVDKIFASIDGATKQTYEQIRKGSDFERVINNFKNFVRLKEQTGACFPVLSAHYIVSKLNIDQIIPYIEMIHSIVGKQVTVQFTRLLHSFEQTKGLNAEIPKEIISQAVQKAGELGMDVTWSLNIPRVKPSLMKCTSWIMPFIFVTGEVIPCCAGNEANKRDFQKQYSSGNIFKENFRQIWHGKKYKKFRRMLFKGQVPVQCRDCCIYDTKKDSK